MMAYVPDVSPHTVPHTLRNVPQVAQGAEISVGIVCGRLGLYRAVRGGKIGTGCCSGTGEDGI